jgi:hypothetical protein
MRAGADALFADAAKHWSTLRDKDIQMAKSSILGGERAALQPSGRGADLLGPSDSSDSGSDSIGELGAEQLASDTDRSGTGDRSSADLRDTADGADIRPDHIARASTGGADEIVDELDDLAVSDDDSDGDPDEDGMDGVEGDRA